MPGACSFLANGYQEYCFSILGFGRDSESQIWFTTAVAHRKMGCITLPEPPEVLRKW